MDARALVDWLAATAEPWRTLYADSRAVSTATLFTHLAALVTAAGLALAADRGTLRAAGRDDAERAHHLVELSATHRVVVGALAVLVVSGLLLALSDVETFATSPVFYVKMALVVLLLGNGFLMTRTERALHAAGTGPEADAGWRRLRAIALASMILWFAVVLAGATLSNA